MKNLFKVLFFLLVTVIVLSGVTTVVLMQPHVQHKIVRKVLGSKVDEFDLENIRIQSTRMSMSGLYFKNNGQAIRIDNIRARWKLSSLIFGSVYKFDDIVIEGVNVKMASSSMPESAKSPGKVTWNDEAKPLLPDLRVLERIQIGSINIGGTLVLDSERKLAFSAQGTGIGAKKWGDIAFDVKLTDEGKDAEYGEVGVQGKINMDVEVGSRGVALEGIGLSANILAQGAQALKYQLIGEIKTDNQGEKYQCLFSQVEQTGKALPIAKIDATLDMAENQLGGLYKIALTRQHLKPFVGSVAWPPFVFKSQGSFNYNYTLGETSVMGLAQTDAGPFDDLSSKWGTMGALSMEARYDALIAHDHFECRVLESRLSDSQGNALMSVNLLQPFNVQKLDQQYKITQSKGELLRISIDEFPLAYINPWVEGFVFDGAPLQAELVLTYDDEKDEIQIFTRNPLHTSELSMHQDGKATLSNINVTLTANVNHRPEETEAFLSIGVGNTAGENWLSSQAHVLVDLKDPRVPHAELSGGMKLDVSQLANQPLFIPPASITLPEALHMESGYDIERHGDQVLVNTLTATLKSKKVDTPYLALMNLQPIAYEMNQGIKGLFAGLDEGDWLKLEIKALPVSLLTFLMRDYAFSGDTVEGAFKVTRDTDPFTQKSILLLDSYGPLHLSRFTLMEGGSVLFEDADFTWEPHAVITHKECIFKWTDFSLILKNANRIPVFSSTGSVTLDLSQSEYGLTHLPELDMALGADLKQVMQLPFVPQHIRNMNITGGALSLMAKTSIEDKGMMLQGQIANLEVQKPNQVLTNIAFITNGVVYDDNSLKLNTDLTLQGPMGLSEVNMEGWYTPEDTQRRYAFNLSGERLFLDDVMLLATGLKQKENGRSPSNQPPKEIKTSQVPDAYPFWQGMEGGVGLDIKAVVAGDAVLANVFGQLDILPDKISIRPLGAKLADAPFLMSGDITFERDLEEPYNMAFRAQLTDLNLGDFLRSRNPKKLPIIEGSFSLDGSLNGKGPNLEMLLAEAQGQCEVKGHSGVVRTFEATDNKLLKASTGIIGLAGAVFEKSSKELNLAGQAVDVFGEINFNEMQMYVKRDETLNITLERFLMKGTQVYLSGEGQVTYAERMPIMDQSMELRVRMDAQRTAASFLEAVKMLKDETNPEGYFIGPDFTIRGSLGKPDFSEFYTLFMNRPGKSNASADRDTASQDDVGRAVEGVFRLFGK